MAVLIQAMFLPLFLKEVGRNWRWSIMCKLNEREREAAQAGRVYYRVEETVLTEAVIVASEYNGSFV